MKPFHSKKILVLPGWQSSDPEHWQSLWEQKYAFTRVQQKDWDDPDHEAWILALDAVISKLEEPVILVAHSLGCHLAARFANISRFSKKVEGALLVAPPNLKAPTVPPPIRKFLAYDLKPLPFPSLVVASLDDPYADFAFSREIAAIWGSQFIHLGSFGHINSKSNLRDWPEGIRYLEQLIQMSAMNPS